LGGSGRRKKEKAMVCFVTPAKGKKKGGGEPLFGGGKQKGWRLVHPPAPKRKSLQSLPLCWEDRKEKANGPLIWGGGKRKRVPTGRKLYFSHRKRGGGGRTVPLWGGGREAFRGTFFFFLSRKLREKERACAVILPKRKTKRLRSPSSLKPRDEKGKKKTVRSQEPKRKGISIRSNQKGEQRKKNHTSSQTRKEKGMTEFLSAYGEKKTCLRTQKKSQCPPSLLQQQKRGRALPPGRLVGEVREEREISLYGIKKGERQASR